MNQFNLPNVDKAKGFRCMACQPWRNWGKTRGIQLQLVARDGRWSVDKTKTVVGARNIQNADRSFRQHRCPRSPGDSAEPNIRPPSTT